MPYFSVLIRSHDRIVLAIREHIGAEEAVGVGGGEGVGVNEPAVGEVIVPALEVVKARFAVVVIAAVAQGIDVPDEGGIRGLFAVSTMHGIAAPRVIGAAAQRDTADNDDDLWLCADGCTHHSDHLSISQRAVLIHRPQGTRKSNAPIIFCASVSLDYPLNCSHAQSQLHLPFLTIEEFRLSGYKDNEKLASSAAWSEAHLRAQTQESASGAFRLTRTG